jgi:type II secretion system protein N
LTGVELLKKTETRKAVHGARWVVLCLVGFFFFVCAALLIIRPYERLGRLAGEMLSRYGPPGATFNGIEVSFPSRIVLTNLSFPVRVNDRQRQVSVEKLSGTVSIPSLLRGRPGAEMNSNFFGGILWLKVRSKALREGIPGYSSSVALEARARKLDISQLCDFFQAPIAAIGRCDADVEADLDDRYPASLNGEALVMGESVEIPPVELEMLILPTNREAGFTAALSAKDGKVFINSFQFDGTAYELSGNGTIDLSEPLERSLIDCSFSVLFKEPPTVTDESLIGKGAEHVVDALVASRSRMVFRLVGTLKEPEAQFDSASSLDAMIQQSKR